MAVEGRCLVADWSSERGEMKFNLKIQIDFYLALFSRLSIEDWRLHLPSFWFWHKRFEWPLPGGTNQNCQRRSNRNRSHRWTRVLEQKSGYFRSNRRFLRLKSALHLFPTVNCDFISPPSWFRINLSFFELKKELSLFVLQKTLKLKSWKKQKWLGNYFLAR